MTLLLGLMGHEVRSVPSGAEALDLAVHWEPRVVFLDIGMDGMSGLEVARRLRRLYPEPGRVQLVAVTGYDDEQVRREARAAGFDQHLPKPVDRGRLEAALAAAIEGAAVPPAHALGASR